MSKGLKSVSPMSKFIFIISLLLLVLWVIPTAVSFYKNEKLYSQKVKELEKLDHRENAIATKVFHAEVFKIDAETYFDKVNVKSIPNDKYKVEITFKKDALSKFYDFLKDLSLNYKVSLDDKLKFEDINKSLKVTMVLKPF
jgi:hypothetical protein